MRGRLLIIIGLILLVVIIAVVVLNSGLLNPTPTNVPGTDTTVPQTEVATAGPTITPVPMVRLVQALQNLPRGYHFPTKIEDMADVAGYVPWPQDSAPFNGITEETGGLESLLGQVARTDIFREQPILTSLIVPDLINSANVGSDAAAILPPDRVAISLPVDRITSVAYAVQDGDHVDVIISMLFVDVDEVFQSITPNKITLFAVKDDGSIELLEGIEGRPDQTSFGPAIIGPSERQRPRLVTQRTIQDAIIVHVGDFPADGKFIGVKPTPTPVPQDTESQGTSNGTPPPPPTAIPRPDIITLAVTPQYAVVLAWAIEAKLPLTLALRSANDTSRVPTQPVTLDYLMSEFNINLPSRRDFSIEPAIRSIRQLLAGQEISLNQTSTQSTTAGQ